MTGVRIIALSCDADGCVQSTFAMGASTIAEARVELRQKGWVTTSGGRGGKRFDYCPHHSGAAGRDFLARVEGGDDRG